jgi:hypothetical protein
VVIERGAGGTRISGLDGGRCAACEAELGIRTSIFKR